MAWLRHTTYRQSVTSNIRMIEKYKIIPYKKLVPKLRKAFGTDFYSKFDYKVETNQGLVYHIDGQTIFLAKNNHDCIIYKDENDLKKMIDEDNFPIQEPEWNPFVKEKERIIEFHLQADHYFEYMNQHLGFKCEKIDSHIIEKYLSKVIGRTIKKAASEKETIGLISIVGQKFKEIYPSKWIGTKYFATYNSFLEPNLVTNNKRIIPVSDIINRQLKWKVKNIEQIFNGLIFKDKDETEIGYDFDQYTRHRVIVEIE